LSPPPPRFRTIPRIPCSKHFFSAFPFLSSSTSGTLLPLLIGCLFFSVTSVGPAGSQIPIRAVCFSGVFTAFCHFLFFALGGRSHDPLSPFGGWPTSEKCGPLNCPGEASTSLLGRPSPYPLLLTLFLRYPPFVQPLHPYSLPRVTPLRPDPPHFVPLIHYRRMTSCHLFFVISLLRPLA